jgi:hypothetical protein
MERQVLAMEREMAAGMRPWVGMFVFEFVPAVPPESADVVLALLRNSGALPAQDARLTMRFYPVTSDRGAEGESAEWKESGVKALVPGEEGNYAVSLAPYPQISVWRDSGKDVAVEGSMSYALEDRNFQSTPVSGQEDLTHGQQFRERAIEAFDRDTLIALARAV